MKLKQRDLDENRSAGNLLIFSLHPLYELNSKVYSGNYQEDLEVGVLFLFFFFNKYIN